MAGRLRAGPARPARGHGRLWPLVLLGVGVAIVHLAVVRDIAARMAELDPAQAMPARLQVAYVRTLEPEVPLPVVPRAVPAKPRRAAHAAVAAKPAASQVATAPQVEPPDPVLASASPTNVPPSPAAASEPASAAASSATDGAVPTDVLASATAASAVPASAAAFEWPASTRVTYLLSGNFRGEITGRAEVEWIRIGERYQVNVSLYAGPEFAPIFSRRMTSEGRIDDTGLVPVRYDEDTRFLMRDRRASVVFALDSVELANGQKHERMAGVQDTASQFIQFTWLFGSRPELLRVGASFEFPLALPRSMRRWTYDVAETETLPTSFGPLQSFHLKPRNPERKPNELAVEMWFAPELRFLPVRIRIEQDAGTYLDLMIARKPEIAAS